MEAVELRQGWSVAKNKGGREKERKKTKEGGLSPFLLFAKGFLAVVSQIVFSDLSPIAK